MSERAGVFRCRAVHEKGRTIAVAEADEVRRAIERREIMLKCALSDWLRVVTAVPVAATASCMRRSLERRK